MPLKNRLDKRDVPSFRSDGWWNARLCRQDAIVWQGKHTIAIQNQAQPLLYPASIAMLLNWLCPRCSFDHDPGISHFGLVPDEIA